MRLKPNAIAVGGTHGKTTTTSMISAFLDKANIGATSIVGGILHRSGKNAQWGTGDYLVAEADEHDGSFLRLHPTIGVVTNIDAEHLEYYGTIDRIKKAFIDFLNDVPFYGYSIACFDDPNIRSILPEIESVCLTYGIEDGASLTGSDIEVFVPEPDKPKAGQLKKMRTRFTVTSRDERLKVTGTLGTIEVNALGMHNVRNALAACAVGLCLGMPFSAVAEGLKLFDGVQRRLQVCGDHDGVLVIEDYAHHPTEIASTLDAVRIMDPARIIAVFQPHLYTRTRFFCDQFARVLGSIDRAIVTDLYPAREEPIPGVDSGLIVDSAVRQGFSQVGLVRNMADVPAALVPELKSGDCVLILGAGNINRIAANVLDELRKR
jgi:UDP-N-acetylmuramate--alanine ligase